MPQALYYFAMVGKDIVDNYGTRQVYYACIKGILDVDMLHTSKTE